MTSFLATNGRPKFKDICIFCGERDYLTGEHLFASWISKVIPHSLGPGMNTSLITNKSREFKSFDLSQQGGYANARMNLLCEKCNSGWGSILQQQTSLILKPIIAEGRWKISSRDCLCIASWVTSFVMVRQFLHPTLAVLDSTQRKLFCDTKKPLESLSLWVAQFDGTRQQLSTWYTGVSTKSDPTKPDMFLVALTMGNLIFAAYGTGSNVDLGDLQEEIGGLRSRLIEIGFVPVWPLDPRPPISNPLIFTDTEYKNLVPLLKRSLLYPSEPLHTSKNAVALDPDLADTVNTEH